MTSPSQHTRSVGILAFDEMEILDYAGPYEVFGVADHLDEASPFDVYAIGVAPGVITARGGFAVVPQTTIAQASPPDILIIPGGPGSRPLVRDREVISWIRSSAERSELVLSVCTGALVLAAAGLLDGLRATTHHEAFDELAAISPTTQAVCDQRFVQSSAQVWTSGGISAGIDLSLRVVHLLTGTSTHDKVVTEMEWGW